MLSALSSSFFGSNTVGEDMATNGTTSNGTTNATRDLSHRPEISELFDPNITAKILHTATKGLVNNNPPQAYPEYVPQTEPEAGSYHLREASFWTCGFFPGSIYAVLERLVLYPSACADVPISEARQQLTRLGELWSEPLHANARRTDTHDMSFMTQPALRRRYELHGDGRSLAAVLAAARSLMTRYSDVPGAIRAWNVLAQDDVAITSLDDNFLVIIDSMMNVDLLFYAAAQLGDTEEGRRMKSAGITHALTVKKHLLRDEQSGRQSQRLGYSTVHVVNFSPRTGEVKEKRTAQGYDVDSTWARGQAWGIFGFAQTYLWTRREEFLDTSAGLADYFLHRLETSPECVEVPGGESGRKIGRFVPLWDFDAPVDEEKPLRDSSAGIIAANGCLLLFGAFSGLGEHDRAKRYLGLGMRIVEDTLALCLAPEKMRFEGGDVVDVAPGRTFEALVKNSTANHNAKDYRRYWDHGLVYADYYLIEFGNRLLKMGLHSGGTYY